MDQKDVTNPVDAIPGESPEENAILEYLSQTSTLVVLTIVPVVLLIGFINLLPILWGLAASFFDISAFSPVWTWTGLSNYSETLTDPAFWASVKRSVFFAGGSVAFQLIVGTAFALVLNRSFMFSSAVRAIVMVPYLIPTVVVGFIALWMGNSTWGIINQILWQAGLIRADSFIPWFGSDQFAMLAVILTSSWKFTIFVTIMVLARLQGIPRGYYEAAEVCGANAWQKFRDITLPNLKGVIFIVLLLRGIWMFNKFDIIWILTKGGPGSSTTTTSIYAFNVLFGEASIGRAASVAMVLFVLLIFGAIVYFRVLEPSEEVRVE